MNILLLLRNIISIILLGVGTFFFLIGFIGLNRFQDTFTRLHATTKCDTLGSGSIILSIILYQGIDFTSLKLILIILFVIISTPTTAHIISKGAHKYGIKPLKEITKFDRYEELKGGDNK
ncbi:cation:proton antiporter [archaeon SCG-AAA382B04]|nr:cation:proton antiporter [archaeon SCG-AAA382B04]